MKNAVMSADEMLGKADCKLKVFPFKTILSFQPLLRFWKEKSQNTDDPFHAIANHVMEVVKKYPELGRPIKNPGIIEKHKKFFDLMMSVIYPNTQLNHIIAASALPFQVESQEIFYTSPEFDKIVMPQLKDAYKSFGMNNKLMITGKIINAYSTILAKHYNRFIKLEHPMIMKLQDPGTGLDKYYKLAIDGSMVDLVVKGKLPELTDEQLDTITGNIANIQFIMELLPPELFEFHGFITMTAIDVTNSEIISRLKFDLLDQHGSYYGNKFPEMKKNIRSLLKNPGLDVGITILPDNNFIDINISRDLGKSVLFRICDNLSENDFKKSLYTSALKSKQAVVAENLETLKNKSAIEKALLNYGYKCAIVAPLNLEGEVAGFVELYSTVPGSLNQMTALNIKELLSLTSIAIKKNLENFNNKIEAVIKEKCTAIHPSVNWRFRSAAINLLFRPDDGNRELEEIVFENVFPLFGLSDIRHSSLYRNKAIQDDLITHLNAAREIAAEAYKIKPLPYIDEILYRTDKHINEIREGLSSGDELQVLEFIRREIESLFDHFSSIDTGLEKRIELYKNLLDPELGFLYKKRKDFEDSISLINETISFYIDEVEAEAQKMFPHYFEKYKTDGIEHGIYIGASLVNDMQFSDIYLKNMRLWQIIMLCGVAAHAERIKPELKVPVELTHLILVQNTPLAIRFRQDEKKFDVDGTYNIRYEIMKKRIDKALIKGTDERLTQPGQIAIVYSRRTEEYEYKRYIEYLQSRGFLKPGLENLDVESLQGVDGLKALRVTVNTESEVLTRDMDLNKEFMDTREALAAD